MALKTVQMPVINANNFTPFQLKLFCSFVSHCVFVSFFYPSVDIWIMRFLNLITKVKLHWFRFDVEGYVTGFGNPDWVRTHSAATSTAPAIVELLNAGAKCVGKTVMDEMAYRFDHIMFFSFRALNILLTWDNFYVISDI